MFRVQENSDFKTQDIPIPQISPSIETTDDISPQNIGSADKNIYVSSEPSVIPLSSESSDNNDEPEPGPSSLDDELVRTINLLNSKADEIPQVDPVQNMKRSVPEKQEACVQTTLPIEASECPSCGCSSSRNKPPQSKSPDELKNANSAHQFLPNERLNEAKQIFASDPFPRNVPSRNKHPDEMNCNGYQESMRNHRDAYVNEKSQVPAMWLHATEKIHEYTVKIEKVVGVPLFTGDYDLDCYVDYAFPKVDSDDRIKFDHVRAGTEIKIALRETEFGAVSRHRLRLSCKLNRALLTLPTNEIIFYLWGRFYSPTPQDYRLGKATLPLVKLSAFELKYEQHQGKQPIIEKFILPISVLNTSLTSGYKGPFGEMHITITYSNASGLSYREWRCKNKDDHYWCRSRLIWDQHFDDFVPNYECAKAKSDVYDICPPKNVGTSKSSHEGAKGGHSGPCSEYNSHITSNNYVGDNIRGGLRDFRVERRNINRIQAGVDSEHINYNTNFLRSEIKTNPHIYRNNESMRDGIVQTNLKDVVDNGFVSGPSRGADNQDIPDRLRRNEIERRVLSELNSRMQPIGQNNDANSIKSPSVVGNLGSTDVNNFNTEQMHSTARRENLVEKVLRDIKQRKIHETKVAARSSQNGCPDNLKEFLNSVESKNAFDSFDLRVDLPTRDIETSDFEANSQYSFLKTPPPAESTFPNQMYSDFESTSSDSVNERVQQEKAMNPFSSQSHMSVSLNSETSLFKPPSEKAKPQKKMIESNVAKNEEEPKEKIRLVHKKSSKKPKQSKKAAAKKSLDQATCTKMPEEDNPSSDETLKSVESLKSYKEYDDQRQSRDVAVGTEFDTQNKDTQTSYKEKDFFKARVEICRALGLPSLEVKQSHGKTALVKPTSQAYFTAIVSGKEVVLKTPVVEKKSNPVWDSSWEVLLPTDLLKKCDRELEIFVELNGDGNEDHIRTSDGSMHCPIVLRTGVDLTPLTAGLEHASGWFSLSDRALLSRAQIKIIVMPLEDTSRFREDWLKEYTQSKGRKRELRVPERSSSLATSLQEKLVELEKLTDKMKRKMASRDKWDESPPLSLLAEVQNKNLGLSIEEIINHANMRSGEVSKTTETATSPIVPLDEIKILPTVVISDDGGEDEDEKGSCGVVETYTISESSDGEDGQERSNQEDSLETPSQTIDRILSRVRKN